MEKPRYKMVRKGTVGRREFLSPVAIGAIIVSGIYLTSQLLDLDKSSNEHLVEYPLRFDDISNPSPRLIFEPQTELVDFNSAFDSLYGKVVKASGEVISPEQASKTEFYWRKPPNEGFVVLAKGIKPAENWPLVEMPYRQSELLEFSDGARMLLYGDFSSGDIFSIYTEKNQDPRFYTTPPSEHIIPQNVNRYLGGISNLFEQNLVVMP